jgi:hypothetical protein
VGKPEQSSSQVHPHWESHPYWVRLLQLVAVPTQLGNCPTFATKQPDCPLHDETVIWLHVAATPLHLLPSAQPSVARQLSAPRKLQLTLTAPLQEPV